MMSQTANTTLIPLDARNIDTMADEQLIVIARSGGHLSQHAWSALISRHSGWLGRHLTGMLGEHDAEDVLQEVFVRVFTSLDEYRGGSLRGWLRQIAQRTAFNWSRDRSTAKRYEAAACEEDIAPTTPGSPFDSRDHLQKIFAALSVEDREVLTLRYAEGLELQALAEALGVNLSAAKMRLKRARLRFRLAFHAEETRTSPAACVA